MAHTIDIRLPGSWADITPDQYKRIMADASSDKIGRTELKMLTAIRLAKIKIINAEAGATDKIIKIGGRTIAASEEEMYGIASTLDFLDTLPPLEMRPAKILGRKALSPQLYEITFEYFITADNYFQGYIHTRSPEHLKQLGSIIYQGINIRRLRPWHLTAIFLWFAAFKKWCSQRWPFFFKPAAEQHKPSADSLRDSIEAMFRALTKGDITKEEAIRQQPAHSALSELNALARESEQLKKSIKK